MANGDANHAAPTESWMADVQRALAIVIVGTFALSLLMMALRMTFWGPVDDILDLLKTLVSALINVVMLVLGYFYGSSKAKEQSDTSQQKIVEKLTSTDPAGTPGPVAPAPPTVKVSWWSLLTSTEQAAIEAAAAGGDAAVQTIEAAFKSGNAQAPDLAALVAKNLLTQERASIIQGS